MIKLVSLGSDIDTYFLMSTLQVAGEASRIRGKLKTVARTIVPQVLGLQYTPPDICEDDPVHNEAGVPWSQTNLRPNPQLAAKARSLVQETGEVGNDLLCIRGEPDKISVSVLIILFSPMTD
jgi:hypothetical protein